MRRLLLWCALAAGCATHPASAPSLSEPIHRRDSAALASPFALASFPGGFEMDGVTGDERVLFTGVITPSPDQPVAVLAASRLSGDPIGSVTPPGGGFKAISGALVLSYATQLFGTSGELLVVDAGDLPPNSHTTLYRYSYTWSPRAGLSTTLEDAHALPTQVFPPTAITGVGYPGGVALLPGGGIAIADAFNGAIWTCSRSLADCRLSMADPAFGVAPAPPSFTGVGRAPGGDTRPYTLAIANGLMPGLLSVEYADKTDEVCGLEAAPPGGLYCVARATLLDTATSPFAKTKRTLVAPQVGLSDGGHGIAFDHWNGDSPWLYWVRSLADAAGGGSNTIRRANLQTGEVQEVASSLEVMDFETGLTTLPPLIPGSPLTHLAAAMGQEENNGRINPILNGISQFVAPSIIAGAIISSH